MKMTADYGVISKDKNPFSKPSWVNQAFPFTTKRQTQFVKLINMDCDEIKSRKPTNEYSYVAFVAIRWGFAERLNNRLNPTDKWGKRGNYNGKGILKKQNNPKNNTNS